MTPATPIHPDFDGSTRVLFVCTGNICRSPLAEGVLRHRARERGLESRVYADSAGTGAWHIGERPDPRSVEVATRNGVTLEGRARGVSDEDLHEFHLVIAMDQSHLRHLERMKDRAGGAAVLALMRDFDRDPGDGQVPDPYYGGPDGFDRIYEMIDRAVEGLLDRLADGEIP
jgi:protein-tyrosine phosphatase